VPEMTPRHSLQSLTAELTAQRLRRRSSRWTPDYHYSLSRWIPRDCTPSESVRIEQRFCCIIVTSLPHLLSFSNWIIAGHAIDATDVLYSCPSNNIYCSSYYKMHIHIPIFPIVNVNQVSSVIASRAIGYPRSPCLSLVISPLTRSYLFQTYDFTIPALDRKIHPAPTTLPEAARPKC
jgi:hypothetical protein